MQQKSCTEHRTKSFTTWNGLIWRRKWPPNGDFSMVIEGYSGSISIDSPHLSWVWRFCTYTSWNRAGIWCGIPQQVTYYTKWFNLWRYWLCNGGFSVVIDGYSGSIGMDRYTTTVVFVRYWMNAKSEKLAWPGLHDLKRTLKKRSVASSWAHYTPETINHSLKCFWLCARFGNQDGIISCERERIWHIDHPNQQENDFLISSLKFVIILTNQKDYATAAEISTCIFYLSRFHFHSEVCRDTNHGEMGIDLVF